MALTDAARYYTRWLRKPFNAAAETLREQLPTEADIRSLNPVMTPGRVMPYTSGDADVADGSKVLPSVGSRPAGNEMAPRAGTASSAPVELPRAVNRVVEAPAQPNQMFTEAQGFYKRPGITATVPPGDVGRPRRTNVPARPLADIVPTTMSEAEGILNAQRYLDQKYGDTTPNEWGEVENWKSQRRAADAASRKAELDPVLHKAAMAKAQYAAEHPSGTDVAEFEQATGLTRDQYVAGTVHSLRLQATKANQPFDEEMAKQYALSQYLDLFGEFQRNKMGRFQTDPFAGLQ